MLPAAQQGKAGLGLEAGQGTPQPACSPETRHSHRAVGFSKGMLSPFLYPPWTPPAPASPLYTPGSL